MLAFVQPAKLRWDDVQLLLALARQGSLAKAAQALAVNISTVSRRLDAAEQRLGKHLFDRTPDGTKPTAAAERILPFAETMEQAALGIDQSLEGLEREPEGVVRLTAPPGIADYFLAPSLPEFFTRYPKLRIELQSSIGYVDLTRREADIAIRAHRPAAGDLLATRLVTVPACLVASEALARSLGTLHEVTDVDWITWGPDLSHLSDAQWIAAEVPEARVRLRTSSINAQLEATRRGVGVMFAADAFARLPGLAKVELGPELRGKVGQLPQASLWLVGHRALREVPRVSVTWDWVRACIDQQA